MAEPARSGPPGAGVAQPGLVLATKLHIPGPRPGFLPRQRLLERLADSTARELTLVCAPAGFGKTSLLGDWARRGQRPVAWLSLDGGDNDPVRFWRYVAAALDQVCDGVGGQVAALLRGPPSLEAVVTVVVNALAGLPDQVALMMDDYHLIETPAVHDSLVMLLERQPGQLRLVLASRTDPPLGLARLRARGQLAEVRERDLRFTSEETALLLREAMGLELSTGSVAALSARTEGWVAGLQLAGLSLQGHADPAGVVAGFSGSHRYVLDYLTEEVLARQPKERWDSCWRPQCWRGSTGRCAMPSPAGPTAKRCSRRSSGPTCSFTRWMRCGAGGATTSCSPTCSRPACTDSSPSGCRSCTAPRRPGWSVMGWPTRPSGTPRPPVTWSGPPGWSSGTSTHSCCASRARRCNGG
jgi:hypothetical protein